ncbi:MAG TPA: DNA repair exonuclease [Bdellovibrionota bacterium]|nr:DNA repair exonuclease [Bdellovibrionota bacterium]
MSKLKILHTGDIHLGSKFYFLEEYAQKREEDFIQTFHRVCSLALKEKIDLILIAGDLFDSPHPSESVFAEAKKGLDKLLENGVQISLIAGTHDDIIASDSVYHDPYWEKFLFLKDPILKDPIKINIKATPVFLYGVSYNTLDYQDPLPSLKRKEEEGLHLGLLHCSLKDSPEWKIMPKDLPCTPEDLFSLKLDYMALGHYHNHRIHREDEQYLSYSGSTEGKRFHETGERFVNILTYENEKLSIEQKSIQTKKMLSETIDLTTVSSEQHLLKTIVACGDANHIARIVLKGNADWTLDLKHLEEKAREHFAYLKIIDEVEITSHISTYHLEKEDTIRGLFIRKMQDKIIKDPERKKIYQTALKEALFYFSKNQNVL